MNKKTIKFIIFILLLFTMILTDYLDIGDTQNIIEYKSYSIYDIPKYTDKDYVIIDNNMPDFDKKYYDKVSFELYNDLDDLGRAVVAFAKIGIETMPAEERGSIGQIKPSGWHTIRYDNIDGQYLYNRCHLIGYQLSGENANEKNLITCTRQMNVEGMLTFENKVSEYINKTKSHVLYRVTPVFDGDNLLSGGVVIEASSVEDMGAGLSFKVFVYNVQDGIIINYKDGTSYEQ